MLFMPCRGRARTFPVRFRARRNSEAANRSGYQFRQLRGTGQRAAGAVRSSAEFDADLIVIGRGVVNRFAGDLRTEAYGIMRESPCRCSASDWHNQRMVSVHLEAGVVEVRDVPRPDRPEGFALIRLLIGGICNTDLELQRGYYGFSGTPGHEFVGEVVAADSGASDRQARSR